MKAAQEAHAAFRAACAGMSREEIEGIEAAYQPVPGDDPRIARAKECYCALLIANNGVSWSKDGTIILRA